LKQLLDPGESLTTSKLVRVFGRFIAGRSNLADGQLEIVVARPLVALVYAGFLFMSVSREATHCAHIVLDHKRHADLGASRPLGVWRVQPIALKFALEPLFLVLGHDDCLIVISTSSSL
jgi:hypothetical protein